MDNLLQFKRKIQGQANCKFNSCPEEENGEEKGENAMLLEISQHIAKPQCSRVMWQGGASEEEEGSPEYWDAYLGFSQCLKEKAEGKKRQ